MAITLNGTTGITTPDITTDAGDSLSSRVAKTGDTMTGTLQMQTSNEVQFWTSNYGIRASDGLEIKTGDHFRFLKGSTEQMRIDSAGRVTMPYQPCFSARGTGSGTNPGGNQTMPFPTAVVNTGSHYNTGTSTFTAPIGGKYFFYFQALGHGGLNARAIALIQLNGGSYIEASATTKDYNSVQTQLIISLSAGDTVRVQTTAGSDGARFYPSSGNQNWFMGYLIG